MTIYQILQGYYNLQLELLERKIAGKKYHSKFVLKYLCEPISFRIIHTSL